MNASPTACTPLAKTILALPPLYPRMRVIVGALALAVPGPRIESWTTGEINCDSDSEQLMRYHEASQRILLPALALAARFAR